MALTKFRLLTTAGELKVQAELPMSLERWAATSTSAQTLALKDGRGEPIVVRGSAIVAVLSDWG